MGNVNIYTTPALVGRFCRKECFFKAQCSPTVSNEGSPTLSEQSLSVVGLIAQAECPIANRAMTKEGWSPGPWGCERTNG